MKARKRNSNDDWQEIAYVQLKGVDILFSEEQMEFQHDILSTELKTYAQVDEEKYWQDVKVRAAIAAMQGTFTILSNSDRGLFREIVVEGFSGYKKTYPNEIAEFAIACADALVEQLKNEE